MAFTLPELPYASDALEPSVSARTLSFHHGKHHAGYVAKLNAAVDGTKFASMSVEGLIKAIDQVPADIRGGVFNNVAQHYNHSFYWKSMTPGAKAGPSGSLAQAIDRDFGSLEAFKTAFLAAAGTHFGSGWGWLVKDAAGKLKVMSTHDADTPLAPAHGNLTPILTVDVWEHAYYLDYQNARPTYLSNFWGLVNWDFAQANFGA